MDEDEIHKYGRHVDVLADAITELTRLGYAKDAAEIGEMAEEETEACQDRIFDQGMLTGYLDSLHAAVAQARDAHDDESSSTP